MAKKGNKNLILSIVALVGALVAGVGLFLDVWTAYLSSESVSENAGSAKLFAEWGEGAEAVFCGRLFEVLAIVAVVAIIASVVLTLITKKTSIITTVLNIVAIAAIAVAIVCACVFFISNHTSETLFGQTITSGLKGAAGFYMIAVGGVVGSVCAFLSARD